MDCMGLSIDVPLDGGVAGRWTLRTELRLNGSFRLAGWTAAARHTLNARQAKATMALELHFVSLPARRRLRNKMKF